MQRTPIEWTHWSVNPFKMRMPDGTLINVCVHKSEGCRFCYAEGIVRRWWKKEWGEFPGYTVALLKLGTPVLVEAELLAVLRLSERIAKGKADPHENKVFWNDMTDEFLEFWPDEFIDKCWAVRALTQNLIHQVLTKRPDRMLEYLARPDRHNELELAADRLQPGKGNPSFSGKHMLPSLPLRNVHVGTSVEDQKTADERIPLLLQTPAAVRWISAEPLLGPVDLEKWIGEYDCMNCGYRGFDCDEAAKDEQVDGDWKCPECGAVLEFGMSENSPDFVGLDWVVVGGESGSKARPMHPDWARSLRDQCVAAGVPYFFKQWGEWSPFATEAHYDKDSTMPGNAEVIGGNCGGLSGYGAPFKHKEDRVYANVSRHEDKPKMVEVLDMPDHKWGKDSLLQMTYLRVGKKRAGRLLDGREWDQFPEAVKAATAKEV